MSTASDLAPSNLWLALTRFRRIATPPCRSKQRTTRWYRSASARKSAAFLLHGSRPLEACFTAALAILSHSSSLPLPHASSSASCCELSPKRHALTPRAASAVSGRSSSAATPPCSTKMQAYLRWASSEEISDSRVDRQGGRCLHIFRSSRQISTPRSLRIGPRHSTYSPMHARHLTQYRW